MDDDAARRDQLKKFADARLAERGDYEADRGDYEADRGDYEADRGDYEADRGDYEADRGDYEADRGSGAGFAGAGDAAQAVADIFRRTAGLGGHLVVAFVAPVGPSSATSRPRFRGRAYSSESESAAARAQVTELLEKIRQMRATANEPAATPPRRPTAP